MYKSYPAFFLFALGLFLLGVFMARGTLGDVIDPPSALLVFIPALFLLLAVFGPGEIIGAFKSSMAHINAGPAELKKALVIFKTMQKLALYSGGLATMLGFILMLHAGSRVELTVKDYALGGATASLGIFYAVAFVLLVCVPFRGAVKKKLAESGRD